MPSGPQERYDFFLSRRGSVAGVAREVEHVLAEKGYRVLTQDYDIPLGSSFIERMHDAVSNSRDLVILFTRDYLQSPYTRKEFTSFEAERAQSQEERHIIVLRCEDVPLRGYSPIMSTKPLWASRTRRNASDASSPLQSASRRQRHRRHDRSSGFHPVSRASQAALTNLIGSTPF
jgi:TIR domain